MFVLFVYVSPVVSSVQVTHKPQGSAVIWMFPINRTPFTSLRLFLSRHCFRPTLCNSSW